MLTEDQATDARMMLFLAGQEPMRCRDIAECLGMDEFTVRRSLIRLCDRGEVLNSFHKHAAKPDWYYERAHGGYSPTGGSAA